MARAFRTLDDAEVRSRRVLVRLDLNAPMEAGRVTDTTRLERVAPTLRELAGKGARVVVLTHFGRPKKGPDPALSIAPLVEPLGTFVGRPLAFAADCVGPVAEAAVAALGDGEVVVLENTRFHAGEEANDPAFVQALAKLGDLYVNDAFSCAHRAHASTEGLAHVLPAYAGRTMEAELDALDLALGNPERPVVAMVGGSKISTKIDLLNNLVAKVQVLVIGGGMANTFLAAQGKAVGKSLCERDLGPTARAIMVSAERAGCRILLPRDAVVAKALVANADAKTLPIDLVPDDGMILDVGLETVAEIATALEGAKTIVWNGPLGAFEVPPFDTGTANVARAVSLLTRSGRLRSVAGGGDTVSALNHAGVTDDLTYVSTAGGAFLEWLEGKDLPGVVALGRT